MATLRQDLIFAARLFRKRPWLTILAVMTLGLGMGAVTTQFIVVKGLFLQRLPFPESAYFWQQPACTGSHPTRFPAKPENSGSALPWEQVQIR